jgi:hypothetical protein
MKPMLKAPGTNPLTLKCDEPLSTFAFKINLRRSNQEGLFAENKVRRCRLTLSNPR